MDDPSEPADQDIGPAIAVLEPLSAEAATAVVPIDDNGAPVVDPLSAVAPEPLAEPPVKPPQPMAAVKQAPRLWYPSAPAELDLAAAIQATVNEPAWAVDDGTALAGLLTCMAVASPIVLRASPSEPRQRCTLSLTLPKVGCTPS